jgi:hypothetical protein
MYSFAANLSYSIHFRLLRGNLRSLDSCNLVSELNGRGFSLIITGVTRWSKSIPRVFLEYFCGSCLTFEVKEKNPAKLSILLLFLTAILLCYLNTSWSFPLK